MERSLLLEDFPSDREISLAGGKGLFLLPKRILSFFPLPPTAVKSMPFFEEIAVLLFGRGFFFPFPQGK